MKFKVSRSASDHTICSVSAVMSEGATLDERWCQSMHLQENSWRPKPDEMVAIFAALGLEGDFWDQRANQFG